MKLWRGTIDFTEFVIEQSKSNVLVWIYKIHMPVDLIKACHNSVQTGLISWDLHSRMKIKFESKPITPHFRSWAAKGRSRRPSRWIATSRWIRFLSLGFQNQLHSWSHILFAKNNGTKRSGHHLFDFGRLETGWLGQATTFRKKLDGLFVTIPALNGSKEAFAYAAEVGLQERKKPRGVIPLDKMLQDTLYLKEHVLKRMKEDNLQMRFGPIYMLDSQSEQEDAAYVSEVLDFWYSMGFFVRIEISDDIECSDDCWQLPAEI